VEAAAAVMAPDYVDSFQLDGYSLRLEYSASQRPGAAASSHAAGGTGTDGSFGRSAGVMDWVCDRCSTTNFARCGWPRGCGGICSESLMSPDLAARKSSCWGSFVSCVLHDCGLWKINVSQPSAEG